MGLPRYHQSVLDALASSGVCSTQQLAEVEVLFRGLAGECAADAPEIWRYVTSKVLLPTHDFAVHVRLAAAVYDGWPVAALGRPPLWLPDPVESCRTNVGLFLQTIQSESWWQAACSRWAGSSGSATGRELLPPPPQQQQQLSPAPPSPPLQLLQWRLLQRVSWEDPEAFWSAVLRELGIRFAVPPERVLQRHPTDPDQCRWLPGARINIAAAALDSARAPADRDTPALLWAADGSPRALRPVGRQELRARVRRLAVAIRQHFKIGDAVAVYMPMTPSAVCLYMAAVLAGCVVVSVADSFSPGELRTRLDVSGAVGVFTQDVVLRGGKVLPLYDKVIKSGTPARAVVLPAAEEDDVNTTSSPGSVPLRPGDLSWADFMKSCGGCSCSSSSSSSSSNTRSCCRGGCGAATGCTDFAEFTPHVADMYNVTNVLFSSGTTGEPKAIPWSHLTPLRCAVDGWAHLDIRPGSVVCWPTNLGWMMGPWLLYAAWLNGATVALYGGAPLGPDFLQFVEAARVDVLGLVPSIVRAWRHGGAGGGRGAATDGVDLSRVRVYGSTGEASAAEDYAWLMSRARGYRPIVEYCGGTEIGGGYVSSTLMHPCAPSTFTTATLGARLVLLAAGDEGEGAGTGAAAALVWDGAPCRTAHQQSTVSGEVALAMPMLGVSQRLLNKDHYQVYYAGMPVYGSTGMPLRRHGDEMAAMPAAGPGPAAWSFCALGRCDDTMNLGGIKVSSVELERAVVAGVAGVVEAAAVGVAPPQGGPEELTLVLVVLRQQTPAAAAAPGAGSSSGSGSSSSRNGDEELQHGKQQIADLQRRCQEVLRTRLNPLFKVSRVVVVPSLPRNASNKVMRRVLRDMLLQLPGQAKL